MTAATFTIWFLGMIMHVQMADDTRMAVLLKPLDPKLQHSATLMVKTSDIVKESGISGTTDSGFTSYSLSGRSLSVETDPGSVNLTDAFVKHVPHLSELVPVKTKLVAKVESGSPFAYVQGYVSYRGGCLSVVDLFQDKVSFPTSSTYSGSECLARMTQFTGTASGNVRIVDRWHPKAYLEVLGSATIAIWNGAVSQTAPMHFEEYNWLTQAKSMNAMVMANGSCTLFSESNSCDAPLTPSGTPAQATTALPFKHPLTVHADCSNTTWP